MSFFDKKKTIADDVVIIGCGRLGAVLAGTLSENGGSVTVIDRSKDSFRKLPPSFGGLTVIGNATDLDVLASTGINKKTTVVCVTNNGNVNIMAAQIAKALFFADRVVARLYDPEKTCICREHGIETICPAIISAEAINSLIAGMAEEVVPE